ncbi:MAG: hypothetical protein ACRYHQ_41080 [Janthinobacterium lividum]
MSEPSPASCLTNVSVRLGPPVYFRPKLGISASDLWRCACLAPTLRDLGDLPDDLRQHFAPADPPV